MAYAHFVKNLYAFTFLYLPRSSVFRYSRILSISNVAETMPSVFSSAIIMVLSTGFPSLSQTIGLKAHEQPAFFHGGFTIAIPTMFSIALTDNSLSLGCIVPQSFGIRMISAPCSINSLALSGYSLS